MSIANWRMHSLRLWGGWFGTPEEVVRWLGAVQAQDYGPAKWSVGQRADGVGDAAVDRAFAEGAILRTHVLRPTWHFVLPEDIRWLLELTGPRVQVHNAFRYRQLELDEATLATSIGVMAAAMRDGSWLTRAEVADRLEEAGIATDGQRLSYILMNAELNRAICSGPPRGKKQTYALFEERAPRARRLGREEALAELTLRYFTSHGPATEKDFRWWSSLTLAEIRRGLELVGPRLERVVIDGTSYWFAEPAPASRPTWPTVHLLQGYDEYIVGYTESKYVLDASGAARSLTRNGALFNHVVILDGQVAGQWKRTLKSGSALIEVALYRPFDDNQTRALQVAADRHGAFLGRADTFVKTSSAG